MSTIDREQVLHVARLARLELNEDEVGRMSRELSKVLDHIEKISQLDLGGVPPTSHVVEVENALRPDEPRPSYETVCLQKFRDMEELLAFDPPLPQTADPASRPPEW